MKDRVEAGRLWTAFEPPDLILLHLEGEVVLQDAEVINRANRSWAEALPFFLYLIDMGGSAQLGADVRRSVATALDDLPLLGSAIYNAPWTTAVVAKLLLLAVNRRRRDSPMTVHDSEEQARAWLETRRQEIIEQKAGITNLDRELMNLLTAEGGSVSMGLLSTRLDCPAVRLRARLRVLENLGHIVRIGDKSAARYTVVKPLPTAPRR